MESHEQTSFWGCHFMHQGTACTLSFEDAALPKGNTTFKIPFTRGFSLNLQLDACGSPTNGVLSLSNRLGQLE